jgi:ectoine hydroxylase-related dioxygenase (phytanoyl-CoA dioxygenase family)
MAGDGSYARDGYALVRGGARTSSLDALEQAFLRRVEGATGRRFTSIASPDLAALVGESRALESSLYDAMRGEPGVLELAKDPVVVAHVKRVLGPEVGVMTKIPFRIDLPNVVRELAVWHQDFAYVKGNLDIVTAWIPRVDVPYLRGSLMVMPRSHTLGPLVHDGSALGKRFFPTGVFDREVRYVEMARGDLLLFNALLIHSSSPNLCTAGRFSIQARYTRLGDPTDPSMGAVHPL